MDQTRLSEDSVSIRSTSRRNKILTSFVPSLSSLFLTAYLVGSFMLNGYFNPLTKRGFFCNDSSINYPLEGETIKFGWLLVVSLVFPVLVIKICDRKVSKLIRNSFKSSRRRKQSDSQQREAFIVEGEELIPSNNDTVKRRLVINDEDSDYDLIGGGSGCESEESGEVNLFNRFPVEMQDSTASQSPTAAKMIGRENSPLIAAFSDVQLFIFGIATTAFFTGLGKTTSGRLRPHFLKRCRPNIDCSVPANMFRYVQEFSCTNELRPRDYNYISTSWPSGKYFK